MYAIKLRFYTEWGIMWCFMDIYAVQFSAFIPCRRMRLRQGKTGQHIIIYYEIYFNFISILLEPHQVNSKKSILLLCWALHYGYACVHGMDQMPALYSANPLYIDVCKFLAISSAKICTPPPPFTRIQCFLSPVN